jgi:hypothetical protein
MAIRISRGHDGEEPRFVVDQFEELFTLVPDEQVRAGFLNSLFSAVSDARTPLHMIVTLRADFYDRLLRYLSATELLSRRSELVGPLSAEETYRAITAPAERAGLELEHDLVAAIMRDVSDQLPECHRFSTAPQWSGEARGQISRVQHLRVRPENNRPGGSVGQWRPLSGLRPVR